MGPVCPDLVSSCVSFLPIDSRLDLTPLPTAVEPCVIVESPSHTCRGSASASEPPKGETPHRLESVGGLGTLRLARDPCLIERIEGCPRRQPFVPAHGVGRFLVSACSAVVAGDLPPSLSALESLCLDQIRFWVGVVARNGGRSGRVVEGVPFTRLPAGDLVDHLTERFPFLSVTLRQVRRALRRLVELGLVVREQFWQSERWRSDYWYSVPSGGDPQVTPRERVAASSGGGSGRPSLTPLPASLPDEDSGQVGVRVSDGDPEVAVACVMATDAPTANSQTALTGESPSVPRVVPVSASLPTAPAAAGTAPSQAPSALPAPAVAGRCPSLAPAAPAARSAWDRINALAAAFVPSALEPVSPSAVVIGGRVRRISDGACSPLR